MPKQFLIFDSQLTALTGIFWMMVVHFFLKW